MKKIFIDCGSNIGQGLKQFASIYNMDSSWIVETFEPNPNLIDSLKFNIKNLPMNITIHNKAIWDTDGDVNFSIMLEESEGSSVEKLMDSRECSDAKSIAYRKHDTIITIPSVNISNILKCYNKDDYIIVKLDIEGSEFRVIRKMLLDNTIDFIDELYVEWHTKYLSSESIDTQNSLIEQLSSRQINIHTWH